MRRILCAARETGPRLPVLVKLARAHIEEPPIGRRLRVRTSKRGRLTHIPITPAMAELINATPKGRLLNTGLSLAEIANHMGWFLRYAASVIACYARVSPDETDAVLVKLAQAKGGAA